MTPTTTPPKEPPRTDYEQDDRDTQKLIKTFRRLTEERKKAAARSDYEQDDQDSRKQISGLDWALEQLRQKAKPNPPKE